MDKDTRTVFCGTERKGVVMRIVIITGATSGMGTEFALQLDKNLKTIDEFWLIGRDLDKLEAIEKKMKNKCQLFVCDFNERTALKKVMQQLQEEQCEIKMLVNCAGYGMIGKFEDISYNDNMGMIDVNCRALTSLTYDCVPFMGDNSRIINLASSGAFIPQPYFSVYSATKSYVICLSRALNAELKDKNVYVTAVCPGPVATKFFERAEVYGSRLAIKQYIMAKPDKVVKKAIRDSILKKELSVYGTAIRAYRGLAKCVPHKFIIEIVRLMYRQK